MIRIIQISTVHRWSDNRVFEKTVSGLATAGHEVHYVVTEPPQGGFPSHPNIVFHPLRIRKGFRGRILKQFQAIGKILKIGRSQVQFHDPELIPMGLLLRVLGYRVVYDIHEDNKLGIRQKQYLPAWFRKPIALAVAAMEKVAYYTMDTVIAEKAYAARFPLATRVLNYPMVESLPPPSPFEAGGPIRLLYTGRVTLDRGAMEHITFARQLPEAEIHFAGTCDKELQQDMLRYAGKASDRVFFETTEFGIPYADIEKKYQAGQWAAGLAVLPRTPHYYEKELTKFFEYMAHGIPVICSDFPVWKKLVEDNNCGICLSPDHLTRAILKNALDGCLDLKNRNTMVTSGRELVVGQCNWKSQLDTLISLHLGNSAGPNNQSESRDP